MTAPAPTLAADGSSAITVQDAQAAGARLLWRDEVAHMVPRAGLHLTDLRRPESPEFEDTTRSEWITRIARRYDAPVTARDDCLFEGQGYAMYRGQIWSDATAIDHTFHPRLRDKLPLEHEGMTRLLGKNAQDAPEGSAMYFQKPGTGNYFHWMIECLPRLHLLNDPQLAARVDHILLHFTQMPGFVTDSINEFFPHLMDRLLQVSKALVRPDRLCFLTSGPRVQGTPIETRITSASAQFLSGLERPDQRGETVIVISRANASNRRLVNEQALIDHLSARFPVKVMIGDQLGVADQRRIMGAARAVVGVHGAGLTNVMFAPRGARLIELTSGQYVNRTASFHDTALVCGVTPHLVLAEEHGDRTEVVKNVGNDLWMDPAGFDRISQLIAD
ncbi:glycosyltransferase family 61 protein [Paracoccus nototheniae]|uniref:glycosyltransferase family 61 protein n=2 Tax=Paracoccus nototheniae TaxID=2489002 RepID=UPI00103F6F4F|nr:glycosyltransferase family 61 protein [Paracoccus nototheniae]